jgi:hypothetical protein
VPTVTVRRPLSLLLPALVAAAVTAGLVLASAPMASASTSWPGHPGRRLVAYVVRPGDTATGLSVRYHAWTDEFVHLNGSHLVVGERVRIPVVLAAVRRARAHHPAHHPAPHPGGHPASHPARAGTLAATTPTATRHDRAMVRRGWRHWTMTRDQVRRAVLRMAAAHHVPGRLALAIAWQESGWQQDRLSNAGAIGVMQVLPSTGRWMSDYVGRRLNLRGTFDNVHAGVSLLSVLGPQARTTRRTIGAYYQGLGAVQKHGLYPDTKRYVASVLAIERNLARGHAPG